MGYIYIKLKKLCYNRKTCLQSLLNIFIKFEWKIYKNYFCYWKIIPLYAVLFSEQDKTFFIENRLLFRRITGEKKLKF